MIGKYETQVVEKKWHQKWEEAKAYSWDPSVSREDSFVIDTPPPTVSGLLHMGHIFSYTQTDFIARYQRMKGKNVFYPIGFDDNGLPTERLVEKERGIRASDLPRADFIKICQEVVVKAEDEFRKLFRSIGNSFDWSQEYSTISPEVTKLSQMSFIDLYSKGHVEHRDAPTFWDPADKTAIAQAEIEDKEKQGVMNYINFLSEDGEELTIATTRPELIGACVAVFYNPADERFAHLKGKKAITPIFNAKVDVIEDDAVDIEKGTGLVMCCTFGDIQDIHWWRKHNLETKPVISTAGRLINSMHFEGLTVKEARAKILEELKEAGKLVKQENITQFVKCAERSGAPLEIIITKQWYIKLLDKKAEFVKKAEECKWYPDYMKVRLENWINGLNQDWCISRQRFFGVPFPVWYSKRVGEEGKILIADVDQLPVDPLTTLPKGYSKDEIMPDMDVMDTWATSSISPQINSKGISDKLYIDKDRHESLFPADLRPQAHEIIRTWTFYTLVKAYYHEDKIPWKNIALSGWVLAADKTKMSKSKGNVVTPTDFIIEKGADVVRYWASCSKLGVDTVFSEELFKIGNKLINKLWNAGKFISMHLENIEGQPTTATNDVELGIVFEASDLWILSRLKQTIELADKEFGNFEYSDARVAVEDFFWNDLCDNYLELIKARVYNSENKKSQQSAIFTLSHVLNALLRLFAPFIPHVCEELNSLVFKDPDLVSIKGGWPDAATIFFDQRNIDEGQAIKDLIKDVRTKKSNAKLALNAVWEEQVNYNSEIISESAVRDLEGCLNAKLHPTM